jgi:hypothetical protein
MGPVLIMVFGVRMWALGRRYGFVTPSDLLATYYDGSQWSSQWDSRQHDSLPIAVEVKMLVGSPEAENPPTLASLDRQRADEQTRDYAVYRCLVHLPGSSVDAVSHSSGFQTPAFQPPGASVP